jgi:hypothetical protein
MFVPEVFGFLSSEGGCVALLRRVCKRVLISPNQLTVKLGGVVDE